MEDSYLIKHLFQKEHQKRNKAHKANESEDTKKSLVIKLKPNKFKNEYMVVSKPPPLILRKSVGSWKLHSQQQDFQDVCYGNKLPNKIVKENRLDIPNEREGKAALSMRSIYSINSLKQEKSDSIKQAWPEEAKHKNLVSDRWKVSAYKLSQRFRRKSSKVGSKLSSSLNSTMLAECNSPFDNRFTSSYSSVCTSVTSGADASELELFSNSNINERTETKNAIKQNCSKLDMADCSSSDTSVENCNNLSEPIKNKEHLTDVSVEEKLPMAFVDTMSATILLNEPYNREKETTSGCVADEKLNQKYYARKNCNNNIAESNENCFAILLNDDNNKTIEGACFEISAQGKAISTCKTKDNSTDLMAEEHEQLKDRETESLKKNPLKPIEEHCLKSHQDDEQLILLCQNHSVFSGEAIDDSHLSTSVESNDVCCVENVKTSEMERTEDENSFLEDSNVASINCAMPQSEDVSQIIVRKENNPTEVIQSNFEQAENGKNYSESLNLPEAKIKNRDSCEKEGQPLLIKGETFTHKPNSGNRSSTPSNPHLQSIKEHSMDTLHCNANPLPTPPPTASRGRRKSWLRGLVSRENSTVSPSLLSHDEKPIHTKYVGSKNKLQLLFDVPYKAKLLKKETNIGQKVHRERKEREKKLGVPVILSYVKPGQDGDNATEIPSKHPTVRTRRNSILEFLHHKIGKERNGKQVEEVTPRQPFSPPRMQKEQKIFLETGGKQDLNVRSEKIELQQKYDINLSSINAIKIPTSVTRPSMKPVFTGGYTSPQNGTPLSTPKLHKRQFQSSASHGRQITIAKNETYNIIDKSPLAKKINELERLKSNRRLKKKLSVFRIDEDSIPTQNDGEVDISEVKTYKKDIPAMLKLRKRVLAIKTEELWNEGTPHHASTSAQCTPHLAHTHPEHIPLRNLSSGRSTISRDVQARSSEYRTSTAFQQLRTQTPLFPSIMRELQDSSQTVKWSNKLGNIFEVKAENGKYGKISCSKDVASSSNQIFLKRSINEKAEHNSVTQRKFINQKVWRSLSPNSSEHSERNELKVPINTPKLMHQLHDKEPCASREKIVVIFSNGMGQDISFKC